MHDIFVQLLKQVFFTVQLYHNSRVPLVSKVENELKSQLKQHLESSTTKIEFIDCEKVTDVDTSKPLLIVCICASRLGTDAATAIQNLKRKFD